MKSPTPENPELSNHSFFPDSAHPLPIYASPHSSLSPVLPLFAISAPYSATAALSVLNLEFSLGTPHPLSLSKREVLCSHSWPVSSQIFSSQWPLLPLPFWSPQATPTMEFITLKLHCSSKRTQAFPLHWAYSKHLLLGSSGLSFASFSMSSIPLLLTLLWP